MDPVTTRPSDDDAGPDAAPVQPAQQLSPDEIVDELLERLLGRAARPRELEIWNERLGRIRNSENFLRVLLQWKPLKDARAVKTLLPAGHLGSPVVDPFLVGPYVEEVRAAAEHVVAGVPFPLAAMDAWWEANRAVLAATPFPEQPTAKFRYAFLAGPYNFGDAASLRALMAERRPRRVVEIGAGAATPCLLDVADELALEDFSVTCIEPAAARLRSLLREGDEERVKIVAETVQGQPLDLFAALAPGDFVLVDSSHILKTGSDVHYLLFHVLPVLAPGVLVQFHDCRFPLEYSNAQIFDKNCSWNEVYALRALLMYSTRFKVLFSGSFYALHREEAVRRTYPPFMRNPGSALWIEVADDGGPGGLEAVGGISGFTARVAAPAEGGVPPVQRPAPAPRHVPGPRQAAARVAGAVTLTPLARRRPDGPALLRAEIAADGKTIAFDIADGHGTAFFGLGVRKSGSTMFHKILVALARANAVNDVNVPGTFFRHGLSVAAWAKQDLSPMVRPGNVYTGFRSYPQRLAATDAYARAKKVFMHRDPRDAIVSQYFSDAFSHELPDASGAGGREKFLEKRSQAQASDIDSWVREHAPSLAKTLEAFEPLLSDPLCRVFPYHGYVFEKRALIDEVLAHFAWEADEATVAAILAEVDVRPESEDPKRFVRKATPGDHKDKLKGETVEELDAVFAKALATFGYA